MLQIVLPMMLFTAMVVVLSAAVLAARHWLLPKGLVAVTLNGRTTLNLSAGEKLLWALAEHGVYLPAACGGRGTCGQCRVTVLEGAAAPLPTESAHITRREAKLGVRLACLTTIRRELQVAITEDILEAKRWECRVVSNRNIATFLKELVLALPDGERIEFEAGDYVLLEAPPHDLRFSDFDIDPGYRAEWERHRLFTLKSVSTTSTIRAYSLANAPSDDTHVALVVRIALPPADAPVSVAPGRASSFIFGLRAGDIVTVSGPFGEFHACDSDKEMVLIAGGAGIAPIRSIILDQLERGSARRMTLWYGARNAHELCYKDEFDTLARKFENFEWHVALSQPRADEHWSGPTGLVHSVVYERFLKAHAAPEEMEYYICGPPLMSVAVLQMLEDLGVESENVFFDDFGA